MSQNDIARANHTAPSSKYASGAYLILGFDRRGTKIFSRRANDQNLIGATHEGMNAVSGGECYSYAVIRVVHNSIKPNPESWM